MGSATSWPREPLGCGDATDDKTSAPTAAATTAPTRDVRTIDIVFRGGSVEGAVVTGCHSTTRLACGSRATSTTRSTSTGTTGTSTSGPGETAELRFVANPPGVLEVELEKAAKRLLELEVQP